jgi:RNA polymerase sigma factor (sigma-70 family)
LSAKATRIIRKYTDRQELIEDFPSYVITSLLSGTSRPWGYLVADFLRDYYGRVKTNPDGTKTKQAKYDGTLVSIDFAPDVEDDRMPLDEVVFLSEFRQVALSNIGNKDMREVVEMYFWKHMSLKQIATVNGYTESRASQLLKEALKRLKSSKQLVPFK